MCRGKTFLLTAIVLIMASVANAGLVLTVNGLDTLMPIEISSDDDIIIAVAGQTDEQKESYSVTCEMGGKLTPLPEANTLAEKPKEGDYLFTFEEGESGLATINLNVGDILDYQLVLFQVPGANTIIFGIDSDAIEIPEPEPEPNANNTNNPNSNPVQIKPNSLLSNDNLRKIVGVPAIINCPENNVMVSVPEQVLTSTFNQDGFNDDFMGMMLLDGETSLNEITQSTILDANTIYYVEYPPLLIHSTTGQEIDVVIPSGTEIRIAEDWDNYAMVIYDGANVHFGSPPPSANEPVIPEYPGDVNNPVPPVKIISESQDPFFNNIGGIYIDRTAGTQSQINNIYLKGFYYAVVVDQQLNTPISNLFITDCYCGITSFGPNRIINSVVDYFGVGDEYWPYWGIAFDFEPNSLDESIQFTNPDYKIVNCLANNGDIGFEATGNDEQHAPDYVATDNVASNCYYGYACWNVIGISIVCPGLYNNYEDKNYIFDFTEPVYETNDPFETRTGDYRLFLDPNSVFVDKGSYLSPALGWTTRTDGIADDNIGDIWPHYQTKRYDKYPRGDITPDGTVDINDLIILADEWLSDTPVSADITDDQAVNFLDFSVLANYWFISETSIEIFNLETVETIDSNNIQGYVGIELKNIPLYAGIVYVYLDNQLIGSLSLDWDDEQRWVSLESDTFANGWHTIRLVSFDYYGNIINHKPVNVYFNNLLYKVAGSDYFHPDDDYKYSGFYDGNSILDAVLTDQDGQTIWSDNYTGQHINIVIPGATFSSEQFCELSITEGTKSGDATVTKKDLTKEFKQADWPNGARMVIVLPNKDVFKVRKPAIIECAEACENRSVTWVVLYHKNVTQENLTYLYNKSGTRYIYWCGHANSHVQNVQRTHTECWRYEPSWWHFNWQKIGVFSWIDTQNPLPDDWDNRGFDLWSLGMYDSWNKKIVFVDGCLSAKYDDMADAYGVFSLQGQGSLDQMYIGWREKVLVSTGIMEQIVGNTTEGVRMFWERMGAGDDIYDAFYYTTVHGGIGMRRAMWGDNGMLDIGDVGGDDNIFLWGNGLITQMELDP